MIRIVANTFDPCDGYGRYALYIVKYLRKAGVHVQALNSSQLSDVADRWCGELTISVMPPFLLQRINGRHWALTMTEGSELPAYWAQMLHRAKISRIIVPSEYNRKAFSIAGIPISVIHGGTDSEDFPYVDRSQNTRPYVFLTLCDRGQRKGWSEVWQAFFKAFPDEPNVRLVIKGRPKYNEMAGRISRASNMDERIQFMLHDLDSMHAVYQNVDCLVLPSRAEGWGMPHREAAITGLPVITTNYSGIDDGNANRWSIALDDYKLQPVPGSDPNLAGEWSVIDIDVLAAQMLELFNNPGFGRARGYAACRWLRQNQSWEHTIKKLLELSYGTDR